MDPPPPAAASGGAQEGSVKGMAIASMVLGIVGVAFALFCLPIAVILALVGLPLGAIAFARQNKGSAVDDSKGMAIAGMVLNGLSLVLAVILFLVAGAALLAGL